LLVGLAACQNTPAAPDLTEQITPPVAPTEDEWSEVTSNDVTLNIRIPTGWQSIPQEYGILLTEHAELHNANAPNGILVYVFIPVFRDLDMHRMARGNLACAVLRQITELPSYVGDSTVSEPSCMRLNDHDAAYYLLSDGEGNRTLVLAMTVETEKILVFNISSSAEEAGRIRDLLLVMLANVQINGVFVDPGPLDMLPNPLEFPYHYERHVYGTEEATWEDAEDE
jgi:hypothetical protein